jgi:hypothetical protein
MLGLGQDSSIDLSTLYPMGGASVSSVMNPTTSGFWNFLTAGINTAGGILATRYAVPQLNQGQTIQQTPYGSVYTQGVANTSLLSPTGSLSGNTGLLVVGGLGLVLVLALAGRGKSN